jgi:hypothetical protein
MIGVNPITAKNDAIVTLHLDDEECGSERLAPHGDDTPGLDQAAPTLLRVRLVFMSLSSSLPSFLKTEYEHLGDRFPIDVTLNIQRPQVLARLFRLLEHDPFRVETHLSNLLLGTPKLGRQREHHVDIHAGRW